VVFFSPVSPVSKVWSAGPESFTVERRVRFAHGYVEERRYFWSGPLEDVVTIEDDWIVLNMALTPRPGPMRVDRLGPGGGRSEEAGRILVIRPGETYRFTAPTGQVRSMLCALSRRKVEALVGAGLDWRGLDAGGAEVEWLLNRIYRELRHSRFAREVAIEGYAGALCVELARRLQPVEADGAAPHKGGLAPWRMQILRERVRADAPAPRLEELAGLCGMTVRQLSRGFKAETGTTLGRFVDEATAERAVRLLTTTDRSIREIAGELGFASSASFAYAFRRTTGALPSQVRRRQEA
jgi:AraC family transcriptional regulator